MNVRALLFSLFAVCFVGCESSPPQPLIPLSQDESVAKTRRRKAVIEKVVNLGSLGLLSTARGVNNLGQVVGFSINESQEMHMFLWSEETGMVDLGRGAAVDINDHGEILALRPGFGVPFVLRSNGEIQNLPSCNPRAINNLGHVVGDVGNTAFLWTQEGGLVGLGVGNYSVAVDINDNDQVAGHAFDGSFKGPFIWTRDTGPIAFQGLPNAWDSFASGVNNAGQVIGFSRFTTGEQIGFYWTAETGTVEIGQLLPVAINNLGHVTGTAHLADLFLNYAFYWTSDSGMSLLPWLTPRPIDCQVYDMNDAGYVVGSSLLKTVPEVGNVTFATLWKVRLPA